MVLFLGGGGHLGKAFLKASTVKGGMDMGNGLGGGDSLGGGGDGVRKSLLEKVKTMKRKVNVD